MNADKRIDECTNQNEIEVALIHMGDSLFNQAINSPRALKKLAEKYSMRAKVLTISCNENLVGLCAYYDNEAVAFISMLVIEKDSHCRGFGTALLNEVIRRCGQKQLKRVMLEVSRFNGKAICFYLKNGFVFCRSERDSITMSFEKLSYHNKIE